MQEASTEEEAAQEQKAGARQPAHNPHIFLGFSSIKDELLGAAKGNRKGKKLASFDSHRWPWKERKKDCLSAVRGLHRDPLPLVLARLEEAPSSLGTRRR